MNLRKYLVSSSKLALLLSRNIQTTALAVLGKARRPVEALNLFLAMQVNAMNNICFVTIEKAKMFMFHSRPKRNIGGIPNFSYLVEFRHLLGISNDANCCTLPNSFDILSCSGLPATLSKRFTKVFGKCFLFLAITQTQI